MPAFKRWLPDRVELPEWDRVSLWRVGLSERDVPLRLWMPALPRPGRLGLPGWLLPRPVLAGHVQLLPLQVRVFHSYRSWRGRCAVSWQVRPSLSAGPVLLRSARRTGLGSPRLWNAHGGSTGSGCRPLLQLLVGYAIQPPDADFATGLLIVRDKTDNRTFPIIVRKISLQAVVLQFEGTGE